MIGTITHELQLVAAGLIPIWAGIVLAVIVTFVIAWLLRSELRARKRAGTLVKILLANRAILAVVLALLLVQPVLYISRIETRPAQLILSADRSRSMLRVDPMDATTLLNLASQFKAGGLDGRVTAADDARRLLSMRRETLAKFREQIATVAGDLSQGVPPSHAVESQLAAQLSELSAMAKEYAAHMANLLKVQPPSTQPANDALALADKTGASLTDLASLLSGMSGKPLTQESSEQLLRAFDQLLKDAAAADATLAKSQSQLDQKFLGEMRSDSKQAVEAFAQKSRFELATMLATQISQDSTISTAHRVILRGFERLDARNAEAHTDLYGVIDRATQQGVDEVVSGLVLFSDGQQNLPERADVLRRIPGRGIPFIAAGVGSAEAAPDVAVVDFEVPAVIQRDKKSPLIVQLKTQLPADTPINVTLSSGDQVIARATATASANGRSSATLEFRIAEAGLKTLTLKASAEKTDAAPENDLVSIPISVLDHPARVLLIGRWPRWDMVHAMQAVATRPTRVDSVFWGPLSKAPPRGSATGAIPDSLESLKRFQLVVLDGAVFAGAKAEDGKLFQDYVAQGGNLVVIASDNGGYLDAWDWLGAKPNASASKPGVSPSIALVPAADADGYPIVHLSADAAVSRSAWAKLAEVSRQVVVPAQSAVLLENASNEPVFTLGFRGRGKVYLLGVADLFRTREWAGSAVANRFLGNIFDDAIQPLFTSADAMAAIYPPAPVAGASAIVVASSDAQIKSDGGQPVLIPLSADKWSAKITTPSAGSFELLSGGAALTAQSVRQLSMEDVDFQLDPARMTMLASAASGKYAALTELTAAIKQLPPAIERSVSVRQIELWNLLALLPIIAALMTLDWYLRRKAGMVL